MPHQCLKCGKVYDEGSSQLLKGCSECKGTQFFYTKKPLTEEERSKIISQMNEDIERIISKHANKTKKTSEETKEEKKLDEHEIKNMIDEYHKEQEKHRDQPETILIERTGKYIIDVKGLLEYEPIIIHKDGVYTIHLPSVFRMINKKRD